LNGACKDDNFLQLEITQKKRGQKLEECFLLNGCGEEKDGCTEKNDMQEAMV
jgi:hypothetical protein